jgi:transglutaminase-like putative cysteine protease
MGADSHLPMVTGTATWLRVVFLLLQCLTAAHADVTLRYSLTVINPSSSHINGAEVHLVAPLSSAETYSIHSLEVSHPYELEKKETKRADVGNEFFKINVSLSPFSRKAILINARLKERSSSGPGPTQIEPTDVFLRNDPYLALTDPSVIRLASSLATNSTDISAENLYTLIRNHISVAPMHPSRQGVVKTISMRKGDCTDLAELVVSVARLKGIPARLVSGFMYLSKNPGSLSTLHDWAEIYKNGGWQIIDTTLPPNSDSSRNRYFPLQYWGGTHLVPLWYHTNFKGLKFELSLPAP